MGRPFLNHTYAPFLNLGTNELMEIYYRNGRMLINMAGAIGRLVLSGAWLCWSCRSGGGRWIVVHHLVLLRLVLLRRMTRYPR